MRYSMSPKCVGLRSFFVFPSRILLTVRCFALMLAVVFWQLFGFVPNARASGTSADFYVATNGNDNWSGKFSTPQGSPPSDGPFATVNRARIAVQSIAKTRGTGIVVMVRAGTYYQTALSFTSTDSGSASTPATYENYPGEVPVLSGGMLVVGWTTSGGNLWSTNLPSTTANFEALYYKGSRRTRPRLGSGTLGTYYRVKSPINSCGGATCYDRFTYNSSDPISNTWKNLSPATGNPCGAKSNSYPNGDIELLIFEQWDVSRERISCIDTVNHTIYLTGSTVEQSYHGYIANHRYIIENVKDYFTLPGQWFLDRSKSPWQLSYIANSGENPNKDPVVIPQSAQVLTATGLQYVTFQGITFSGDNFVPASTGYASNQTDRSVTAAVNCNDCSHVTFDSDTFTSTTGHGLGMVTDNKGSASSDLIQNSAFYDLGAGGILLGFGYNNGQASSSLLQFTTVQNNIIQGIGRMYPGGAAIAALVSHDITITHNEINDAYNEGVNVCIPNNSAPCGSYNMVVSYNNIWNLGQGLLNDFGAVYFATYATPGNKILNNKMHDMYDASIQDSDGYGGHAVYMDVTTGLIDVENNLAYRTSSTIYNMTDGPQSNGIPNTFKNNIAAYPRTNVVGISLCPPTPPPFQFSFTNNLVYLDRTSRSKPNTTVQKGGDRYFGTGVPTSAQQWANNMYWNSNTDIGTATNVFHSEPNSNCTGNTGYTLAGWQAFGEDAGSVAKDPGFKNPSCNKSTPSACVADPTQDDYSLPNGSPGVGFVIFETGGTCSTCPGRTNPVIIPPSVPATFTTALFNPSTDF